MENAKMARPASPPGAEHAADQALDHIPTTVPPPPPQDATLPDAAFDNMADGAIAHIPDWLIHA
jgi:hypothetical protein